MIYLNVLKILLCELTDNVIYTIGVTVTKLSLRFCIFHLMVEIDHTSFFAQKKLVSFPPNSYIFVFTAPPTFKFLFLVIHIRFLH